MYTPTLYSTLRNLARATSISCRLFYLHSLAGRPRNYRVHCAPHQYSTRTRLVHAIANLFLPQSTTSPGSHLNPSPGQIQRKWPDTEKGLLSKCITEGLYS